ATWTSPTILEDSPTATRLEYCPKSLGAQAGNLLTGRLLPSLSNHSVTPFGAPSQGRLRPRPQSQTGPPPGLLKSRRHAHPRIGAHAEPYYKPHGYSSSLPIYLWMEAGRSVGIWADGPPTAKSVSTADHLVTRLKNLGITWKGYFEGIDGTTCPLVEQFPYAV